MSTRGGVHGEEPITSAVELMDETPPPPRVPVCPHCQRVMSWREHDEQGACNDCYDGWRWSW